jgi:serine/threonine protein kinase
MTGAAPAPAAPSGTPDGDRTRTRERIGRYAIARKIGEGGMGVVYEARDERLERSVAVKTMTALAADETARKRFWREARAAAAVNHPNVCQLYEIGEDGGELFIAMELLSGESLSDRLKRGPLSLADALPIALGMLAALEALHARGIVHRDLKPSNVFLTPHGVKLLDFGLARPADADVARSLSTSPDLTRTGMMVGTPRYMSPEQIRGEAIGARGDLFAAGAILFEMLAGRPAFTGKTVVEILHATLNEQPPALTGSPAVAAADRVIRRALAKRPEDRPASAEAMAAELRAIRGIEGDETPTLARALTRLVVMPFRVLRPDPDTDFLAYSLPDAIATSLSGIGSIVVRSSATAARFAGDAPDLKALAVEADVDRVVMGTLLRAGDRIRAATQLVEAPGGTLLTSHTVQAPLGDLFGLQDEIAHRVVEALALPLGGKAAPSPAPDAPHDPRAYELYLRANDLGRTYQNLAAARDLYKRCLELDPAFAPAWAQLGRCERVIAKFVEDDGHGQERAEEAFRRALAINPRLSLAHKFLAQLESEIGRAQEAMVRLLGEAARHGNDPELFAGLVHALRYCGLIEESMAAHHEARRLDPNVPTSGEQTVLMTADIDRLLAFDPPPLGSGDDGIRVIGLGLAGRREEARRVLGDLRRATRLPIFQKWAEYLVAWLDRRPQDMPPIAEQLGMRLGITDDPEAIFQEGWLLCDAGIPDRGLPKLGEAVEKGYFVASTLSVAPAFAALREDPAFRRILAGAEEGRRRSLAAFRDAGGPRLIGVSQWEGRLDRLEGVLDELKRGGG